jgi:two-component system, OmpR family, response regulator RegX3
MPDRLIRPTSVGRAQPVILVVEDERSFVDALTVGLEREGFSVVVAFDGAEALTRFDEHQPDLVLLDLMLPKLSGIDVCRAIRLTSRTPVIMVTAKSSEIDTVVGLEVGADDYIAKPYRLREVVARIRAVLRRAGDHDASSPGDRSDDKRADGGAPNASVGPASAATSVGAEAASDVVEVGDVRVDETSHEVLVRGQLVALPRKEYDLLVLLLSNAGRVLTRDLLIERVWGYDYVGDTKTLDVHVKRLRAKIETDPAEPTRILTVRGFGYKYAR